MSENKVKINLEGLDGNAHYLIGAWVKAAREQGFSQEHIDEVTTECMSGDYSNLIQTLLDNSIRINEVKK